MALRDSRLAGSELDKQINGYHKMLTWPFRSGSAKGYAGLQHALPNHRDAAPHSAEPSGDLPCFRLPGGAACYRWDEFRSVASY